MTVFTNTLRSPHLCGAAFLNEKAAWVVFITPTPFVKTVRHEGKHLMLFYCCVCDGRPTSRSMRLAIGGWVEKRLAKLAPEMSGATMKRCAVEGEAPMGS